MKCKSQSSCGRLTRRTFAAGVGAAGFVVGTAPFAISRAQAGSLKVAVLLPLSGLQAGIGQDCHYTVDFAPQILKALGLPELSIMSVDTEFERRHGTGARGKGDRRRRAASGRRLRFRPDHRRRPGRRAKEHSTGHQHRRSAADH